MLNNISLHYIPHFIYQWIFELSPHLAIINNAALNIGVQISVQFSAFNYFIPSRIAESYDDYRFHFLRSHHTVFHSCGTQFYIPSSNAQGL